MSLSIGDARKKLAHYLGCPEDEVSKGFPEVTSRGEGFVLGRKRGEAYAIAYLVTPTVVRLLPKTEYPAATRRNPKTGQQIDLQRRGKTAPKQKPKYRPRK